MQGMAASAKGWPAEARAKGRERAAASRAARVAAHDARCVPIIRNGRAFFGHGWRRLAAGLARAGIEPPGGPGGGWTPGAVRRIALRHGLATVEDARRAVAAMRCEDCGAASNGARRCMACLEARPCTGCGLPADDCTCPDGWEPVAG